MIDKRLFELTEKKNLFFLVGIRLVQLIAAIVTWLFLASQVTRYSEGQPVSIVRVLFVFVLLFVCKGWLTKKVEQLTYQASADLRIAMRAKVLAKAFRLGKSQNQLPSSVITQLSVDGIEQVEIYYARFLPQLFYCIFASLLIFGSLVWFDWVPAVVLFICMPLIPIIIMSVMKAAKRILGKYWTRYTDLGKRFYENLSGLSTLKAYQQDEAKQKEAAADAQQFRHVTMKLLAMQLNSITIMDIISYCGAAVGIGLALFAYAQQELSTFGLLMFLLLSAEFFLPMRQLGSLFHVAMNGISACKKLFNYLALPEQIFGIQALAAPLTKIDVQAVTFRYDAQADAALQQVSFSAVRGQFTALVGKSGSGKSTIVRLLLHQLGDYEGTIYWNDVELRELNQRAIYEKALLVDNHGFLYPTTIKENLLLGKKDASDEELWHVIETVQLTPFITQLANQLDEPLGENGANLSGGQRQRLLLARALLRGAEIYVFDEITSGVDLASETIILTCLRELAQTSIVLFISHRLYNVLQADQVLVFEQGKLVEAGAPASLQQESQYFKNYFIQEQAVIAGGDKG